MKRILIPSVMLCVFLLAGLVTGPAFATDPPPAQMDLVRPGDRTMPCDALAAEINALSRTGPESTQPGSKPKKGPGFLQVLGGAAPMLGGLGGVGGAMAAQAMGAASEQAMRDQIEAHYGMTIDPGIGRPFSAGLDLAGQRRQRLLAIFEEQRC